MGGEVPGSPLRFNRHIAAGIIVQHCFPGARMARSFLLAVPLSLAAASLPAQQPYRHEAEAVEVRYAAAQPVVRYRIVVDSTDTTAFQVEIIARNLLDTFRLAMPAHPEYDEEYW